MAKLSLNSQISKCSKTADFYDAKGRKFWAQAKNGGGGENYCYAREAFGRAKYYRDKADKLRGGIK
ncbi:MAG: hypothetical protein ACI4WS_11305 [Oscillospiraceae bacterium]